MRRIQRARSAITCGGYASRRNDEEEEEEKRERETDGEREWDRTRDGMKRGCYTSMFRARARNVYTCDKHTRATSTCAVCTNTASPWRAGCAERKRERGREGDRRWCESEEPATERSGGKGARDAKEREKERERDARDRRRRGGRREKEKEKER